MPGSNLGLSVIAEGVETEAQCAFLKAEGCHLYQGFLYSPAITGAQFEAFVGASLGNEIQDVRAVSGIDDPPLSVVEAA
jgi:EAL domain-containing protein (putative c-di-GMP-specific phosphodiesterase class I)